MHFSKNHPFYQNRKRSRRQNPIQQLRKRLHLQRRELKSRGHGQGQDQKGPDLARGDDVEGIQDLGAEIGQDLKGGGGEGGKIAHVIL